MSEMSDPVSVELGRRPGKVIAVHLNYPSRAAQRGRTPEHPSYFLKAPTSLTGSGEVTRPDGTELLAFEGEIALVIGTTARSISPSEGWAHVGWVTAANDLGLYDLRHADAGANLRSKSGDGFTPVGPELIPADRVDPAGLRVRTWLNGELRQEDTTDTLLFEFGHLVADLSRLSTLEFGDVILTGTPAGATVFQPGDVVEVEVDAIAGGQSSGRLRTTAVAGPPLAAFGAQPKTDEATKTAAYGTEPKPSATEPSDEVVSGLTKVGVATISSQLRKRGLNNIHIDGVHPAKAGSPFAGRARTLRFLPAREDLSTAYNAGFNAHKRAIDTIETGEVLVMEARGEDTSGTLGDILALRARVRGAAAIVTDGGLRDSALVAAMEFPVFHAGAHPAVLGRRHIPWETDVAIGCGGTVVRPGDIVVGDDDGVLVIPPEIAAEVLADSIEQERQEEFVTERVAAGAAIKGLYPLNADSKREYLDWLRERGEKPAGE